MPALAVDDEPAFFCHVIEPLSSFSNKMARTARERKILIFKRIPTRRKIIEDAATRLRKPGKNDSEEWDIIDLIAIMSQ
ncbi:hypothetical protein [Methylovirgula sp. 4M-Z18]|uniref:hypothetical protein n=1 Tax=Methylovirgula sp. 4M-Z18 TaxID=2293567 RepID=UPI000E2FA52C|nr:hypothetical protein [Methylovirgula sp. 4M-Z18]